MSIASTQDVGVERFPDWRSIVEKCKVNTGKKTRIVPGEEV